jgi:CRP/FNR family transcriptional regulator
MHIVQKGGTLYRAGTRAESLYSVRKGMLKSVVRDADGTRLVAVHLPGEVLGLGAASTRTMAADIVAVTPTIYCTVPLATFTPENHARVPLLAAAVAQLRAAEHAHLQANTRGTLAERVSAFFTNLSERLAERGMDPEGLNFDVTREELAAHFERSVDSMRRALKSAEDSGVIRLQENKIQLRRQRSAPPIPPFANETSVARASVAPG